MRFSRKHAAIATAILLTLSFAGSADSRLPGGNKNWKQELINWRAQHAIELQKPDGWLSLVGLEWLQPGENSFGSAPDNQIRIPGAPAHLGILVLSTNKTVELRTPAEGFHARFLVGGVPVTPRVIPVDADSDKNAPHFTIATLNMYVIRRADRFALRIKDSKSAALTGFHGLKWFPPQAKFDVTAKWTPYVPARTITLAPSLYGISYDQPVPGVAEFILDGKTYRIEPVLEDAAVPQLFFVFRDATSTSATYPACRVLYTAFPNHGLEKPGTLELDFNKLENLPCAYTPYATCPLPPPQNRLPIALPVGERRYHE